MRLNNPKKELELNSLLKEICIRYHIIFIIISSIFSAYYLYEDINPLSYVTAICPVIHSFLLIITYRLNYESFRVIIPVYLVYISLFLYANAIFYWHFEQITAFIWFSIVPVATMIFFSRKVVILSSICTILLISSVFILTPVIPDIYFESPTSNQFMFLNILTIILSLGFLMFFVYYLNKITFLRELQLKEYEANNKENIEEDNTETNMEKLDSLYIEILQYFKEKEPYKNPDFTISQLAKELQSNVKYVSKAINRKENVNFSIFLNTYRIKLIKELIEKDYYDKYTIGYIYTYAGFRHQSTFNKVFKDIEGITPSEYIKGIKKKRL